MNGREPFGYVVEVSGTKVTLNLLDAHRGHFVSHRGGISPVTEVGQLFGLDEGARTLVLRVRSLSFLEPREAHRAGVGSTALHGQPLRHLEAVVLGSISRSDDGLRFEPDSLLSPALGAAATALRPEESRAILCRSRDEGQTISMGTDVRGGGELRVPASALLPRHVAVLGSTGQGKSCLTAAVLQQLVRLPWGPHSRLRHQRRVRKGDSTSYQGPEDIRPRRSTRESDHPLRGLGPPWPGAASTSERKDPAASAHLRSRKPAVCTVVPGNGWGRSRRRHCCLAVRRLQAEPSASRTDSNRRTSCRRGNACLRMASYALSSLPGRRELLPATQSPRPREEWLQLRPRLSAGRPH